VSGDFCPERFSHSRGTVDTQGLGGPSGLTATILCADDDRNFCRILARALTQEGYRVETAYDGEAALERIRVLRPQLVTLDVMLPRRDGFEVLEALRRSDEDRSLPVLLMTGCTLSRHYLERGRKLRADAMLQKPIPLEELLRIVGRQLGAARGGRSFSTKLSGTLQEIPVPTLLHHLHGMRASGVLQVQHGKKKKQVQLREGSPVAVRSNLVNETLGKLLVASGRITEDVLHESLLRVKRGEGLQGQILKAMHMLDEEDLATALRKQAEEKLFELFTWPEGQFRFHRAARLRGGNRFSVRRTMPSVILEGIRWRTPLAVVDGFLIDHAERFPVHGETPFFQFQDAPIDDVARSWLERLDGKRALSAVLEADENDRRSVYALLTLEILSLRGEPLGAQRRKTRGVRARVRKIRERRHAVQTSEARATRPSPAEEVIRQELAAMAQRFQGADAFQVLGVAQSAGDAEIRAVYTELAKRTHPDRFIGSSGAVIRLAEEVFGVVSQAYEAIGERAGRLTYLREQRGRDQEKRELEEGQRALRAELEFQRGEQALKAKSYGEAAQRFKNAMTTYPEEGEYRAYFGWAWYLVDPEADGRLREALEHVLSGRKLAPDREKPYLFLGRLYKADNRMKIAEKMFTRAVQLDPSCVEALRELRLIDMRRERSKGIVRRLLRR